MAHRRIARPACFARPALYPASGRLPSLQPRRALPGDLVEPSYRARRRVVSPRSGFSRRASSALATVRPPAAFRSSTMDLGPAGVGAGAGAGADAVQAGAGAGASAGGGLFCDFGSAFRYMQRANSIGGSLEPRACIASMSSAAPSTECGFR